MQEGVEKLKRSMGRPGICRHGARVPRRRLKSRARLRKHAVQSAPDSVESTSPRSGWAIGRCTTTRSPGEESASSSRTIPSGQESRPHARKDDQPRQTESEGQRGGRARKAPSKNSPLKTNVKEAQKGSNDRSAYVDLINHFYQRGNMRRVEDTCKRALKVPNDGVFYPQLRERRAEQEKNSQR